MKIIKIKNCGRKCEYFVIIRLLLMIFFECSHPIIQVGNVNKKMTDEDLEKDFPSWCPLEDYKEDKGLVNGGLNEK